MPRIHLSSIATRFKLTHMNLCMGTRILLSRVKKLSIRRFGIARAVSVSFALFCAILVVLPAMPGNTSTTGDIGNVKEPSPLAWTTYHSYNKTNSFVQELFNLSKDYPDICKVFSIGKTWQRRDLWVVKISDNVDLEENEPGVWFDAAHHSREWLTTEFCLYVIHKLVDEYANNSTVKGLVDSRQIWVLPLVNVDGRVYDAKDDGTNPTDHNIKNSMGWRKNFRDNNGNGIFDPNYDGVDLNRNYGYGWCNGGSDVYPSSDIYMGPDRSPNQRHAQFMILFRTTRYRLIILSTRILRFIFIHGRGRQQDARTIRQ